MIKITMASFDFAICKRLVNQNIVHMSQLAKKFKQIEQLNKEKDKRMR